MADQAFVYGFAPKELKYAYGHNPYWEGDRVHLKDMALYCARNDSAACQVLLLSTQPFAVGVSDQCYFHPSGPMETVRVSIQTDVPDATVELRLIGLVTDDDGQQRSDILLEEPYLVVPARKIQQVWLEIHTSKETLAGAYKGTVRLYRHNTFEEEQLLGTLPFTLQVFDVAMPDPADYTFYLDLWQHSSNIARKYGMALWSEAHFDVLEEYVPSLAALGQKAATVIASEIPWSGQRSPMDRDYPSDLFEYSMIGIRKTEEGSFLYDFSAMDRYIELCERHGIRDEIEVFGLTNIWTIPEAGFGNVLEDYEDGIRLRYLDEADGCYKFIRDKATFLDYVRALEGHFVECGWIDRVRIIADEPSDKELYLRRVNTIKAAAPGFRFKAAVNSTAFIEKEAEQIHDFVPYLPCALQDFEKFQEVQKLVQGRLCWYVCCGPERPNTFIRSPLVESRLIGWLTEYLGLDGFLRWNYTVWPQRPLERISFRSPHWAAGDTLFVYPGKSGEPMLTLRYKLLQRGVRDFEAMQMAKERPGGVESVGEVLSQILRFDEPSELHPASRKSAEELYSLSGQDYDDALRELLAFLEEAT